jgi:transcriptional regulator with XRE-family HTH domain
MRIRDLQDRLSANLRERVRGGELTERGLARLTRVSQPHIHNVLKGKRLLSTDMADQIMEHLRMDVLDLIDPVELLDWHARD